MEKKEPQIRRDFLGNEITIGDEVVYSESETAGFRKGKIIGFTAKRVKIVHDNCYERYETALNTGESPNSWWMTQKADNNLVKVLYTDPESFRRALFPV